MIMDNRARFFTFSGFILCLFCIILIQESGARVETINVVDWCNVSSIVKLKNRDTAILKAEEYGPLDCKLLIETKRANTTVVIAFYEYNVDKNDKLVFHDGDGVRLSFSGRGKYYSEERSFMFKGPVTVHYVTSTDRFSLDNVKFQFVYSVARGLLCNENEFRCANNLCVPSHLVCDNHNSCGDRSDENDCTRTCATGEFRCANRKCIQSYKICDTYNDCGDSSDEVVCNRTCNPEEYKCHNRTCISKRQVCDRYNDCGDWSDEKRCTFDCFYNSFICHNQKCIESKQVCDGHDNCGDNSDEQDCYRRCYSYEFKCRNPKCIRRVLVCDGRNDCGDMSDEENCKGPTVSTRKPKVTVDQLPNPWLITIIVAAVILAIIIFTFSAVLIRGCVADKKKRTQIPTVSANTDVHQVPPPNFFERIRQSFRSARQTATSSSLQSPDQSHPQPVVEPQPYQVPSMYPQLSPGVDNPEFHADE